MSRRNSSLLSTQKLFACVAGSPRTMMRSAVIVIILTSMLNQSGSKPLDPDEKCVTGRNCAGTDYGSTITVCPAVYKSKGKMTIRLDFNPRFPITDGSLKMTAMISGQTFAQETFSDICQYLKLGLKTGISCPFPANRKTTIQGTVDIVSIDILNGVRQDVSLIIKAIDTQGSPFLCNNVTITYDGTSDKNEETSQNARFRKC